MNMNLAIKKGLNFGLTSGVITTLGIIIGLALGTQSKLAVISGILIIAIADSLSDALGIHISEESDKSKTHKQVWESTFSTLFYKFIIALTFLVPILLLNLNYAIIVSIIWGFFLLGIASKQIAQNKKIKTWKVLLEHYIIAIIVIILTYYLGLGINKIFI